MFYMIDVLYNLLYIDSNEIFIIALNPFLSYFDDFDII